MPQAIPFIMAATAVISAAGTIYQGQQAKKAANYNAAVREQDAIAAKKKAAFDADIHRDRVRQILSKQKAIIGASGLDMSGSPLLATLDTVQKGELDAMTILHGGDVQAARFRSDAVLSRMQGKSAQTSSYFQAGSTLLSGGTKAYKTYKGM